MPRPDWQGVANSPDLIKVRHAEDAENPTTRQITHTNRVLATFDSV